MDTQLIKGNNEWTRMFLLTVCVAGLQFTWGVEMSYVNVYLLSLGLSKPMLSIVWVAGPLSGLFMQPLVGVLSDNSTSKYGKRRPYILLGSILVAIGLLTMAWAKDIVSIFVESDVLTIILAVLSVFLTDFAINAVQACCRAIIVDTLPQSKQEQGNGWAGRMIAIGHLIGYTAGYLDLVKVFGGWLGDTQLKTLCVISSVSLLLTSTVTCLSVNERIMQQNMKSNKQKRRSIFRQIADVFKTLLGTMATLPKRMIVILEVQLAAWYGWFTFLFYSATWVSEVYIKYSATNEDGNDDDDQVGKLARVGSMSLMVFSIISLVNSLVLPEIIKRKGFRLTTLWMISHVVYAFAAFLTRFVTSVGQATCVVGIFGFSWAVTTWAPFALLAEEILKLQPGGYELAHHPVNGDDDDDDYEEDEDDEFTIEAIEAEEIGQQQSGIYLGIHNVAITLPQFISTLGSFCIFKILNVESSEDKLSSKPGTGDGGHGIAYTLQIGGITALIAALLVRKLQKTQ